MGDNFGIAPDAGTFNRKFTDLQRQIEALRSERRSASTTVASGDFTVTGGGSVVVKDGGSVAVANGGAIRSDWPSGSPALTFGPLPGDPGAGDPDGRRLQVLAEDGTVILEASRVLPWGTMPAFSSLRIGDTVTDVSVNVEAKAFSVEASTGIALSGGMTLPGTPTTSASANAVFSGILNQVLKSTSSRRYKQDEEPAEIDPAAVLQLVAKTWRDRAEVEADPNTERRYIGLVAEDLDDLGLTEFVVYDDEGRPDAISYDRLAVALLAVAQDQQTRLERLEQAVALMSGPH